MALLKTFINMWIATMPVNALNHVAINSIMSYSLFKPLLKPGSIIHLTLL